MSLGALVVNLSANIAQFTSDMGRASQVTEQAMTRMGAAADRVKSVLGMVGVALSVDLIVGEINKTIGALADLDDMAQKTGASVENLSKLSKVALSTGVDFGEVDGALVKLAKNMTTADEKGSKFAKAMKAIGIETDGIKQRDPAELFVEISNKMQGFNDSANKAGLMTDAISKSAANLLPYMNDVSESFDKFTGDTAEAAAKATQLQDSLGLMTVKYEELKTEILIGALPAATDFIQALMDTKHEADGLSKNASMTTWADDAGLILSRLVDRVKLTARALMLVGSSVKAVAADIQVAASLNPAVMAYEISQGRNPMDRFRATMAERQTIVKESNAKLEAFLNSPISATEDAYVKRLRERQGAAGMSALGGMAGVNDIGANAKRDLSYSSGDGGKAKKTDAQRAIEQTEKLIADMTRERDAYGLTKAAVLEYRLEQEKIPAALAEKAVAIQMDIDKMEAASKADKESADAEKKRIDEAAQAQQKNADVVDKMRQDLMTDAERDQEIYDTRMHQLQAYHDARFENESLAYTLMEAETARHEKAKADIRASYNLQSIGMMGNTADQLYNMLKQSGEKQSGLARAAFLVSKAIAVAEIIMQTNVAAAKAKGQLGIFGMPMSAMILATGYAQAGMVAGLAVASAKDGYDIPEGVNPVVQTHAKEMILPRAQAEVIRSLATNGGARGGGATITYSPQIHIDSRTDQGEVRKLVYTAVQQGNADLVDKLARAGRI